MEYEILETPIRFRLCGKSAAVPNDRYAEVGMQLMGEMWNLVKGSHAGTTGINHWVYLPAGRMFVGVELLPSAQPQESLEQLEFELKRY